MNSDEAKKLEERYVEVYDLAVRNSILGFIKIGERLANKTPIPREEIFDLLSYSAALFIVVCTRPANSEKELVQDYAEEYMSALVNIMKDYTNLPAKSILDNIETTVIRLTQNLSEAN